jgi:hypothetical protein
VVVVLPCAQHDFEEGQFLAVFGSQLALSSFFSVEVEVVVVVVEVVVDFAGVCGVWANTIPAIRNIADAKTIAFFIVICFWLIKIHFNGTKVIKVLQ